MDVARRRFARPYDADGWGHKEKLALAILLSLILGTGVFAVENGLKPDQTCFRCLKAVTTTGPYDFFTGD